MTVEQPQWCGDEDRRSDYWSATLQPHGLVDVAMSEYTTISPSQWWDADEVVQVGYLSVGRDEALTMSLTFTEPIDELLIYPRRYRSLISVTLSGSTATLTVASSVPYLFITANGHMNMPLMLKFNPLGLDDVPPEAVVYDINTPPSGLTAGQVVYFEKGVYEIGDAGLGGGVPAWFTLESGATPEAPTTLIVPSGAFLIGNFDYRQVGGAKHKNIIVRGNGVLSGEYALPEVVTAMPFFTALQWAMFYGDDGVTFDWDNVILQGLTITRPPNWMNANTLCHISDVMWIDPWHWGHGAFQSYLDDDGVSTVTDCLAFNFDDTFMFSGGTSGITTRTRCYGVTGHGSIHDIGYGFPLTHESYVADYVLTLDECGGVEFALNDPFGSPDPYPRFDSVFRYWSCGPESLSGSANIPLRVNDFHVDGPLQCALIQFENLNDPFAGRGDYGRIADIRFDGFDVEFEPVLADGRPMIVMKGRDIVNQVHNVHITGMVVEGRLVAPMNLPDFAAFNPFHYHVFFGERMVTSDIDICNTALSYIGERDRVTSIDPVDGSEESRQCARAYPEAFEELLEMHNWSFNTKKIQLTVVNDDAADTDDPAWAYRYELPEGLAEALSVLPDGHIEDYVVGSMRATQNFHRKLSATDDEERIYSNVPDAWLRYTIYITDPNQCTRLFLAALTWLVAAKLAGTVARGESGAAKARECLAMFGKYLSEAKTKDARQRQVNWRADPASITARRGNPWTQRNGCLPNN